MQQIIAATKSSTYNENPVLCAICNFDLDKLAEISRETLRPVVGSNLESVNHGINPVNGVYSIIANKGGNLLYVDAIKGITKELPPVLVVPPTRAYEKKIAEAQRVQDERHRTVTPQGAMQPQMQQFGYPQQGQLPPEMLAQFSRMSPYGVPPQGGMPPGAPSSAPELPLGDLTEAEMDDLIAQGLVSAPQAVSPTPAHQESTQNNKVKVKLELPISRKHDVGILNTEIDSKTLNRGGQVTATLNGHRLTFQLPKNLTTDNLSRPIPVKKAQKGQKL